MQFFIWKDSYDIGIEEIDRQHRDFLELLNDYHEVLFHVKKATVGTDVVDKLKLYISNHFKYEEKLFSTAGYKETELQLKQHTFFESRVADLENAQAQGSEEQLDLLLNYLRDWFLNHILVCDMAYVPTLKSFTLSHDTPPLRAA